MSIAYVLHADEAAPPRAGAALKPCPFCGSPGRFQPHETSAEIVRVACAGERCGVRPATEYLLDGYRDELVRAWNTRPSRE